MAHCKIFSGWWVKLSSFKGTNWMDWDTTRIATVRSISFKLTINFSSSTCAFACSWWRRTRLESSCFVAKGINQPLNVSGWGLHISIDVCDNIGNMATCCSVLFVLASIEYLLVGESSPSAVQPLLVSLSCSNLWLESVSPIGQCPSYFSSKKVHYCAVVLLWQWTIIKIVYELGRSFYWVQNLCIVVIVLVLWFISWWNPSRATKQFQILFRVRLHECQVAEHDQ